MGRRGTILAASALAAGTLLAGSLGLAAPAQTGEVKADQTTADYHFAYSYPRAAAAIPALARWFESDRSASRAGIARDAAAFRREAQADKFPFRAYERIVSWKIVTDTPSLLSLSGTIYSFSGGAHGNTGSMAMVWDKTGAARLDPKALFASPAALWKAISPRYCRALDAERVRRRGEPVAPGDIFGGCPPLKDLTLLLGSTNRRTIDRIGLIADQYVAGSYAEGAYEITLPVDAAVLAAVKPDYRTAFAAAR